MPVGAGATGDRMQVDRGVAVSVGPQQVRSGPLRYLIQHRGSPQWECVGDHPAGENHAQTDGLAGHSARDPRF